MREQTQTSYVRWLGATIGDYRLETLLGQSVLGPLFAAQHTPTQAPALVRVLDVPPAQSVAEAAAYEATIERQAGHIATLRHPYILPLIGYGMAPGQGQPYLVWASPTMRSLTMRLAQSGPVDVVTVGRYLDQIAAALEYAHEHATIHRNLSTDCIYLQLDGQLVVADFGVRRLFELLSATSQPGRVPRFYGSVEACAPEQLLGAQAETYTDVYALGGVTYRLLIGQPPFSGDSFETLAQRHLRAVPPSLAGVGASGGRPRAGQPAALDEVLAGALAKDPAQRIQHPGELANAYHRVIDPPGARRVPFATPTTPSEPTGAPLATIAQGPAAQMGRGGRSSALAGGVGRGAGTQGPSGGWEPSASSSAAKRVATRGRVLAAALLLVVLVGGGLGLVLAHQQAAAVSPGGTIAFLDSGGASTPTGSTNAIQMNVRGLSTPPSGEHYQAWFINQASEQILALGPLAAHANQTYTLSYAGSSAGGGQPQNLLAFGNAFEITLERAAVEAPAGKVVLSAAFPPDALIHIKHVLLSFPTTPGAIGLLVGVLRQTSAANDEAQALQQAVAGGRPDAVQCHAQNILDILEGTHGTHYQPLSAACAALGVTPLGDGFGLLNPSAAAGYGQTSSPAGYIADAADHASLAATTPDATAIIRQHAAQVQSELAGVKSALTAADASALRLLAAPTDTVTAATLAGEIGQAYGSVGHGGGSATGAIGAYLQGQLMATLTLA